MKFIHLTDLHISPGSTRKPLAGTEERSRQAFAEINAVHGDAELCIITGDIVDDPHPEAYDCAEELISTLTMPVYSLLGNHDNRAMGLNRLSSLRSDRKGFAQQAIPTSAGLFLTLDTNNEPEHNGMLCADRLDWIKEKVDATADPIWIFMHQAPFATGLAAMDTIGLDPAAARALGEILATSGKVAHLFFGHYHRPMSGVWNGVPFSSHRSMMMQCALDLTEPTYVPAVYEEAQYSVVLTAREQTVVHYHDFASRAETASMGPATG